MNKFFCTQSPTRYLFWMVLPDRILKFQFIFKRRSRQQSIITTSFCLHRRRSRKWNMRANREAFEKIKIIPRMLRDVSVRDTSIELFRQNLLLILYLPDWCFGNGTQASGCCCCEKLHHYFMFHLFFQARLQVDGGSCFVESFIIHDLKSIFDSVPCKPTLK